LEEGEEGPREVLQGEVLSSSKMAPFPGAGARTNVCMMTKEKLVG
jgi:hypothetical protein